MDLDKPYSWQAIRSILPREAKRNPNDCVIGDTTNCFAFSGPASWVEMLSQPFPPCLLQINVLCVLWRILYHEISGY